MLHTEFPQDGNSQANEKPGKKPQNKLKPWTGALENAQK